MTNLNQNQKQFITSESVTEWHPDKICDQISDAVLDQVLQNNPNWACCCEAFITKDLVVVWWEVELHPSIDIEQTVRSVLKKIGYTKSEYGIDADNCKILNVIQPQSPDIAQWENEAKGDHAAQWAGDQWMMFGYACNETDEYMPLPITLAHKLTKKLAELRKNNILTYLRPDGKSQVTVQYDENLNPVRVDTVVIATQHDPDIDLNKLRQDVKTKIILPVCGDYIDDKTKFYINETGRFVVWWPEWDTGLTGRKIIVDTYGGVAKHGGWAFSWKVPNKQDRSWAYIARYVAKHMVAAWLADRFEIQLSYAIGFPEPTSIHINTFGTWRLSNQGLTKIVLDNFDLTPKGIIDTLDLKRPIYSTTAVYGHFWRAEFPWEKLDKLEDIKNAID